MNVKIESALVHERIFVTEMEDLPLLPHRAPLPAGCGWRPRAVA
jgi:hypothetical protein